MKDLFYERKHGNEKKKSVSRENHRLLSRTSRRDGCSANNLSAFSQTLGYQAPSLYNHFKNIRDVKTALTAKLLQELNDQLRRALVGKSGQEALQIYAETYRSFAFSNQAVYELLISVPHTNEAVLLDGIHETSQIILQIFEAFQLTKEEKVHRSRELRSMIHGYLSLRFFRILYKRTNNRSRRQLFLDDQ